MLAEEKQYPMPEIKKNISTEIISNPLNQNSAKSLTASFTASIIGAFKELVCCCFILNDSQLVLSTACGKLVCMGLLSSRSIRSLQLQKCFASSLDFEPKRKILLAGLSNNCLALFLPNGKGSLKLLKVMNGLTAYPLITSRFAPDLEQFLFINSANQVVLARQKSGKKIGKYKARILAKGSLGDLITDIKILRLEKGIMAALISEAKVRLILIRKSKRFRVGIVDVFSFRDSMNTSMVMKGGEINFTGSILAGIGNFGGSEIGEILTYNEYIVYKIVRFRMNLPKLVWIG